MIIWFLMTWGMVGIIRPAYALLPNRKVAVSIWIASIVLLVAGC